MSLLFNMFQSILSVFVILTFLVGIKLICLAKGGSTPPFVETFANKLGLSCAKLSPAKASFILANG